METLERRQYLDGLPTFDAPDALTVETSQGATVTDDPMLQGPVQFPFAGGQPKDELVTTTGTRIVAGSVGGNWAIARYTSAGALDQTFGSAGKVTLDLGASADRALNVNVRPNGTILVMGLAGGSDTNWQFAFVRLNSNGTLDSTFGASGKLLTGLGRAPTFGCVTLVLNDGRIHVTGWANGAAKAFEYDANGRNGFDRLQNPPQPLHAASIHIATPSDTAWSSASARPLTVQNVPRPGTLAYLSAHARFMGPMPLPAAPLHVTGLNPTTAGHVSTVTLPHGKGRIVAWEDGSEDAIADDTDFASHSYLSEGTYHPMVSGHWVPLAAPASFHSSDDPQRVAGIVRATNLQFKDGEAVDLDNNDFVLDYTGANPFTTLYQSVLSGYSASPNSLKSGIVSTMSQTVHEGTTVLALFDNALAGFSDYPAGSGNTISSNAIVGKYTYIGDTDYNGQVTPQDYTATDSNLGTSVDLGVSWFYGDTNFDGNIDPIDYGGIDAALGLGAAQPLSADVNVAPRMLLDNLAIEPATTLDNEDSGPRIVGPQSAQTGDRVSLTADGVTGSLTYIWSIQKDGKGFATGEGKTFAFFTGQAGTYTADLTVLGGTGGSAVAATRIIRVRTSAVRSIVISGPESAEVGQASAYSANVNWQDPVFEGVDAFHDIGINWSAHSATESLPITTFHSTALFAPPADATIDPTPDTFTITCDITVRNAVVFHGTKVVAAEAAAPEDFIKHITSLEDRPDVYNYVIAKDAVELPDGSIIVLQLYASSWWNIGDPGFGFLEKYTPDLKIDPNFGANGNGRQELTFSPFASIDGSLDLDSPVKIALQEDGKILVATDIWIIGAADKGLFIARYNPDGSSDLGFGVQGQVVVQHLADHDPFHGESYHLKQLNAIALQPDGKILVGGSRDTFDSTHDGAVQAFVVVRLNSDGSLDDGGPNDSTDGDAFGQLESDGTSGIATVRVASDANRGTYGYTSGNSEQVMTLKIQPYQDSFRILVGGSVQQLEDDPSTFIHTQMDFGLVRLDSDGDLDTSFGDSGRVITHLPGVDIGVFSREVLHAIDLASDGSIVAMGVVDDYPDEFWLGYDSSTTADSKIGLAKYSADGILDLSFGDGTGMVATNYYGADAAYSGFVDSKDRIVIAGDAPSGGLVARFEPDGDPDLSFGDEIGGVRTGHILVGTPTSLGDDLGAMWIKAIYSKRGGDFILAGSVGESVIEVNDSSSIIARYKPTEPAASDLTATPQLDGPIDLEWTSGTGQNGFTIQRALGPEGLNAAPVLAVVGANDTTYRDSEVIPNTTYYYRVTPFISVSAGEIESSGPSADAFATTVPAGTSYVLQETVPVLLQHPGNPLTTGEESSASTAVLEEGKTYLVRATGYFHLGDPGVFSSTEQLADAEYGYRNDIAADQTPLTDIDYGISLVGVEDGTGANAGSLVTVADTDRKLHWGAPSTDPAHSYSTAYTGAGKRVAFYFKDDYSDDNDPSTYPPLTVEIYRAEPSAPGNLFAEAVTLKKEISLSWKNLATDGTQILIERRQDNTGGANGGFVEIASLPADATSFTDQVGVLPNHKYTYRVRVQNDFGESRWSNLAFTVLVNLPPKVALIPAQVAHEDAEFKLLVDANDPEDAQTGLIFSLQNFPPTGMVIDSDTGMISGWTPTTAVDEDDNPLPAQSITVRVTDQDGNFTDQSFSLRIAPDDATIPHATTAAYEVTAERTATTVRLKVIAADDGGESNLTYTWSVLARPSGAKPVFGFVNGTHDASEITATLKLAGTYRFRVTMNDGSAFAGTSDTVGIVVASEQTSIGITPIVSSVEEGGTQIFTAKALDQFGKPLPIGEQPTFHWAVDPDSSAGTIGDIGGTVTYTAPTPVAPDAPPTIVRVWIVVGGVPALEKQALVKLSGDNESPIIIDGPHGAASGFSKLRLTVKAEDPDANESELTYTWELTGNPGSADLPTFASSNGTNAAKEMDVLCDENKPLNYTFQVTIRDKWGATVAEEVELGDARTFTSIALKSAQKIVTLGAGSATFQATALDDLRRPMTYTLPDTPPDFLWKVVPAGIDKDLVTAVTGDPDGSFTFTPMTAGAYTVYVETSASTLIVAQAGVSAIEDVPPIFKITDPGPQADGAPATITEDTTLSIIADDLNDDASLDWYVWLRPQGGARSLLASGTNQIGDAAGIGEAVATLRPTMLANGLYTVELTSSDAGDAAAVDVRFIEIKSNLKMGGLTLPVTDLSVDVPGGGSLSVTRVYDSMHAGESQDFGYGWRLLLSDSSTKDTARPSRRGHDHSGAPTFRNGDLLYITLPDGSERVFAFVPKPTSYNPAYPGGPWLAYYIQFVSVDGSNSTLNVNGDRSYDLAYQRTLTRDGDEFYEDGTGYGYNPKLFGNYTLTAADGTKYTVDATTGKTTSSVDSNGNTTSYGATVTSGGMHIKIDHTDGRIATVSIVDGSGNQISGTASVQYAYVDGELRTVTGQDGSTTTYSYDGPRPHLLTGAVDDRDVPILAAEYDTATAELTKLTDATGSSAPISSGAFNGQTTTQTVKDPAGGETENRYNDHGDVVRTISTEKDASGKVTGYTVLVHEYDYGDFGSAFFDIVDAGKSVVNMRLSENHYDPIHITGNDPNGTRFSIEPAQLSHHLTYNVIDSNDSGFGLPHTDTVFDSAGNARTTTFSSYVKGKPQIIQDGFGNYTYFKYDGDSVGYVGTGNLLWTVNAYGEGTAYVYSNDTSFHYPDSSSAPAGLRKGLVLATKRARTTITTPGSLPADPTSLVLDSYNRYNADGTLLSTTNAVTGLTTSFTYTAAGQVEDVNRQWTDGGGAHNVTDSHTTYDNSGRVQTVTDVHENVTETHYHSLGKVSETIDVYGGVTRYTYDAVGNLIRTLYPDSTETRTSYDVMGRVEWTTDRYVSDTTYNTTTHLYTDDNEATALGTRTIYDSLGRTVGSERYDAVIIQIASDSVGTGVLKSVTPNVSLLRTHRLATTGTKFDSAGRVAESVNADGLRTGTIYYPNGQVRYSGVMKSTVTGAWWSTVPVDPDDVVPSDYFNSTSGSTHYEYDLTNSLPGGAVTYDKVTDALGHFTKTYKDKIGRSIRTTYNDGSFAETQFGFYADLDSIERPSGVDAFTYVKSIEQRAADTDATTSMTTVRYYDQAGRLVGVMEPDLDVDGNNNRNNGSPPVVWRYVYDANGNQTKIIDPRSEVANQTGTHAAQPIETTFTYNEQGQRLTRTLPDGQSELWTYDNFGRTETHKDFKDQTTKYLYDDTEELGGRLLEEQRFTADVDPSPDETTAYGYDSLGQRDSINEYNGPSTGTAVRTTTYDFDPITGQVKTVTSPEGTLNYEYDPATGRHTRTSTSNNDTRYDYDSFGRLWHVTVWELNNYVLTTPLVTAYTYDAVGNLDTVIEDNATTDTTDDLKHDYGYDNLNRVTTLTVTRGTTTIFSQTYVLAADGQRESSTEIEGTVTTFTDWEYDAWNRLKSEFRDVGNGSVLNTTDVNTPNSTGDYYATYTLDSVGNRLSKVVDDYTSANDETITSRYVFVSGDTIDGTAIDSGLIGTLNGNDWLLGTTTTLGSGSTTRYDYNNNGSTTAVITAAGTLKYMWDLRNRLMGLDKNGDGDTADTDDATLTYDSDGTQVKRAVVGGDTTEFLKDKNNPTGYSQILEEKKNATLDRSYIVGQSVLGQSDSNGIQLIASDGHGSTRVLVKSDGTVTLTANYDSFGNALGFTPASAQTHVLYTNQVFDPILEQYLLRARYYNQALGRFNSFDSYEGNSNGPASLHKFVYGDADPINGIDPLGTFTLIEGLKVGGGIAALLAIGFIAFKGCYQPAQVAKFGIRSTTAPKSIAIVEGPLGWQGAEIPDTEYLRKALKKAGHKVTYVRSPNEAQFTAVLNNPSFDLVLTVCHGPDRNIWDANKKPFAALKLGGISTNNNDNASGFFESGIADADWVTANELEGKVSNKRLNLVVAGCNAGATNRLYSVLGGGKLVASPLNMNSQDTAKAYQYVSDFANGTNPDAWWVKAGYVINPTNKDFDLTQRQP
jgi:RHS repeat-associated protein/uncharacterized delta-60 repeat protein